MVIAMLLASTSVAGDSSMDRSTLRGLKAVRVVVDSPAPELERQGVVRDRLRAAIEQKLRDAGITVDNDAIEFLGLSISSAQPPRRAPLVAKAPVSLVIGIGLYQIVVLNRDKTVKTVTETWGDQRVAPAAPKAIERTVTEAVDDLAGEFINAYRGVNPKP